MLRWAVFAQIANALKPFGSLERSDVCRSLRNACDGCIGAPLTVEDVRFPFWLLNRQARTVNRQRARPKYCAPEIRRSR